MIRLFLLPENNVEMALYWQFLNGYFGMVRTEPDNIDGGKVEFKPAYPLFKLWADHLQDRLLPVKVESPRSGYAGGLKVRQAMGEQLQAPQSLRVIAWQEKVDFTEFKKFNIESSLDQAGTLRFQLNQYSNDTYLKLARLPWPIATGGAGIYWLQYEARFTPTAGSATIPIAMGFTDARGWNRTFSSMAIGEITSTEWSMFSGEYTALLDSPGADLWIRLEAKQQKISGTLEIKNVKIEALSPLKFPSYALLTASASKSADGKKLSIIVFNKSETQNISTAIALKGFDADSAKKWVVNGTGLGAINGVVETQSAEPFDVRGGTLSIVFPAHSMVALELIRK